jgi:hypothetical protein
VKSPSIGPFDKNKSTYFCFDSTICTRAWTRSSNASRFCPDAHREGEGTRKTAPVGSVERKPESLKRLPLFQAFSWQPQGV